MSIRGKLFAGYFALILIFVISFFLNKRLFDQVSRNTEYLHKSENIIRLSNMLHKLIIDMQSGYRGFLLTGQDAFLEPFDEALHDIPPLSTELKSLLGSPAQTMRLDSIMSLHRRWVSYAQSLIKVRNDTLPEGSRIFRQLFEEKVKAYVGKKMNDKIRHYFMSFDEHEYQVRMQRRNTLEDSIEATYRLNLGLTIFFIGLAVTLSLYVTRAISRRITDMVTLAGQISGGDFKQIIDPHRDELHKLSESLNSMSATLEKNFSDLKQKNKDLDDFAYVVSHDLKAPLRGIDNIINWLEEDHGELHPDIKKSIELIRGRARRLENMINGLLAYARIGKAKKVTEPVAVDAVLKELSELIVPASYKISWGAMPVLRTNPLLLEQVFSNLISNAIKYNDKAYPEITITAEELENHYLFRVKDNGIGIQREYYDKIFQIFQTLRERDAFESTGVGLAIVKRIVEEQKGTIHVESEPGVGSTFIFTWHKN